MHLALHRIRKRGGDPHPPAPATEAQREAPPLLVRTLFAIAVLTSLVAVILGISAHRAQQAISENTALVDRAATADATKQVTDVINRAFSFDYGRPGSERVAADRMRGQALAEYQRLLQPVKQQAAAQKLVVTTTVKSAGVIALQDGQARVLVHADQFAVRAGTDQYSGGPAQLEVTAQQEEGGWNITGIRLL